MIDEKDGVKARVLEFANGGKILALTSVPGVDIPFTEKISAMAEDARLKLLETGHTAAEQPTNMPVVLTDMDRVLVKKAEMEKEGLQDLSILGLNKIEKPRKRRVFECESELRQAYLAGDPDAIAIVDGEQNAERQKAG